MRTLLLAVAAVTALAGRAISGGASPEPGDTAPPPIAPAWSWTGCFVGGHAGGLSARSTNWTVRTPGGAHFGESLG